MIYYSEYSIRGRGILPFLPELEKSRLVVNTVEKVRKLGKIGGKYSNLVGTKKHIDILCVYILCALKSNDEGVDTGTNKPPIFFYYEYDKDTTVHLSGGKERPWGIAYEDINTYDWLLSEKGLNCPYGKFWIKQEFRDDEILIDLENL